MTNDFTPYVYKEDITLEYADKLLAYARSLCRDKADAEDLVQETYLRAFRALSQLAPNSNIRGWMYTIMRNVHLNRVRSVRTSGTIVTLDTEQENSKIWVDRSSEDPHSAHVRHFTMAAIRKAIYKLPHLYREVLIMREIRNMSYREIAIELECPIGTVMSRLRRGRERLRDLVNESGWAVYSLPPAVPR